MPRVFDGSAVKSQSQNKNFQNDITGEEIGRAASVTAHIGARSIAIADWWR